MADGSFPREEPVPGGMPYASDMKKTFDAVRKLNNLVIDGGDGVNTRHSLRFGAPPKTKVCLVEITDQVKNSAGEDIQYVYLCRPRYYDAVNSDYQEGIWKCKNEKFPLDARDLAMGLTVRSGTTSGQIVSAYWDAQRGAFIPTSGGTAEFEIYQVLSDLDEDVYLAYASPADDTINPNTYVRSAVGSTPAAIVADTMRQVGAWVGDWVVVQETGLTYDDATYGSLTVYEIIARVSAQIEYWALLYGTLTQGGQALVVISINGYATSRYALDGGLLLEGQEITVAGSPVPVRVSYDIDQKHWYVTGAPCAAAVTF